MKVIGRIIFVLAMIALIVTLVSIIPSDQWFIRTVDMVRVLLVFLCIALLVIGLFLKTRLRWLTIAALILVIGINAWRVWPYWAVADTEVPLAQAEASQLTCFSALSANVKVKNTGYQQVADQIRKYDPDVLFLMETDDKWLAELEPVLSGYPTVRRHPQPKAFGLAFATRVPASKINVVENTHRDTPTLYATLQPAGFPPVEFIGLHPKPPLPGWDTGERDRNIVNAGVQTPDRLPNAVVMGDFNDVPWSRTTEKFHDMGNWNDPRIGRGSFGTFPADYVPLGWPLDQLMMKGDIQLGSFEILDDNGSDHLAVLANICVPSDRASANSPG